MDGIGKEMGALFDFEEAASNAWPDLGIFSIDNGKI